MMVFLKSLGLNCWTPVIAGWQQSIEASEDEVVTLKTKLKWYKAEDEATVGNYQAFNALFNAVDPHMFKLINTYTFSKKA